MAKLTSRQQLKEYCLRSLGQPVIHVNVEDSQVEDRIDEGLSYFADFHHDGGSIQYYSYQMTADDITNQYILTDPISPNIITINRIFEGGFNNATNNIFNVRYQLMLNDFYGLRSAGSLLEYSETMKYLDMMEQIINPKKQIRFNRTTNKLHIDASMSQITVGTFLAIEAYTVTDPEVATEIYTDKWLKKFTTALIKRQWGINLSKYEGIPLPGGIMFNGAKLYDAAILEIKELEEEIEKRYQLPPDFVIG